jgi:hypothetical protein
VPRFTYEKCSGSAYGSRTCVPALRVLLSCSVCDQPLHDYCMNRGLPRPPLKDRLERAFDWRMSARLETCHRRILHALEMNSADFDKHTTLYRLTALCNLNRPPASTTVPAMKKSIILVSALSVVVMALDSCASHSDDPFRVVPADTTAPYYEPAPSHSHSETWGGH